MASWHSGFTPGYGCTIQPLAGGFPEAKAQGIDDSARRWLLDVDSDGRDEILCYGTDETQAWVLYVLKYDLATGTLEPGAPPAGQGPSLKTGATPNPAHRATTIAFGTTRAEPASIELFDVAGRHVKTLTVRATGPGQQSVIWDGTDEGGRAAPSGTFFYTIRTGEGVTTRKVVLLH